MLRGAVFLAGHGFDDHLQLWGSSGPGKSNDRNPHETIAEHCQLQDYNPGGNRRLHGNKQLKKKNNPIHERN